ncbi:MAG TPA: hypothetical protein VK158_06800 [Acidobacteriota bacterium]|nr:hypothetical protein [Acidobacteriota bacterium]
MAVANPTSKDEIIHKLVSLYEQKIPLEIKNIAQIDPHLSYALQSNEQVGGRKFSTLNDAREAVAQYFISQGRKYDAGKVRRYNKPRSPTNKYSQEQRKQVMDELVAILKQKVAAGQDVRYTALLKSDSKFAKKAYHYYRNWPLFLSQADIDHTTIALNAKYPEESYICVLYDWYLQGNPMDAASFATTNPDIEVNLREKHGSYYKALAKLQKLLIREGLNAEAEECDIEFWKESARKKSDITADERKKEMQRFLDGLPRFDTHGTYPKHMAARFNLEFLLDTEYFKGIELKRMLIASGEWHSPEEFGTLCGGYSPRTIIQKKLPLIAQHVVLIKEPKSLRYLISQAAVPLIPPASNASRTRYANPQSVAQECGVTYGIARQETKRLQLGRKVKHVIRLGKREEKQLREVILQKKASALAKIDDIVAKLSTKSHWTATEIARKGIPSELFYQIAREKNIGPKALQFPAQFAINYFKNRPLVYD